MDITTKQFDHIYLDVVKNKRRELAKEFIKIQGLQDEFEEDIMTDPLLYCITYHEYDILEFLSKTKYKL